MQCDRCLSEQFTKAGRNRKVRQLYRCRACGRRLTTRSGSAFSGYRFPDEVIALAVRWYLRYRLSYAEVAEWLAECGVIIDPSTPFHPSTADRVGKHALTAGRMERVGRFSDQVHRYRSCAASYAPSNPSTFSCSPKRTMRLAARTLLAPS